MTKTKQPKKQKEVKKTKKKWNQTHQNYTGSQKRKRNPYPGLEKSLSLKRYSDWIDYDYIDKLSDEEKRWLSDFTIEALGGDFRSRGKENAIHNTDELKKECYGMANRTDRDLYNVLQRTDSLTMFGGTVNTTLQMDIMKTDDGDKSCEVSDVIVETPQLKKKQVKISKQEIMYDAWRQQTEDDIINTIDEPYYMSFIKV